MFYKVGYGNIKKINFQNNSVVTYLYYKLFFQLLIFKGRKLWAFNFFSKLKFELKRREFSEPYLIFLAALVKLTPDIMLSSAKFGGVTNYIPVPLFGFKQYAFAVRFIIKTLRDKYRIVKIDSLAEALILAISNKGLAMEKKFSIYKIAVANRHLRKRRFFK